MKGDTSSSRRRLPRRVGIVLAAALGLLLAGLAQPALPGTTRASIDPRVEKRIARDGTANFWVLMRERADLSAASSIRDWAARGAFVVDRLKAAAESSQGAVRDMLAKRGASYSTFWISNAIRVQGGDRALLEAIAARPEVARIVPDIPKKLDEARPTSGASSARTPEWNIDRIRASDVWETYGIRGAGVVVSSVDTGVYWKHPALRKKYRGADLGSQTVDHNYNWWNPTGQCPSPNKPCDPSDHGTHTMGTMVGDDEHGNQVGVAPEAKWIAAKGCGVFFCENAWLLSAGEFILAPTDLNGNNPRPGLRPNVVNNSWGGGPGDPFYQDTVNSWVAAGIFPAFSVGNSGPGCQSAGSPGDFRNTYAAGAFDIDNAIADFSSRGKSAFGGIIKPNIAAPGVGVRSSVPTNGYDEFDGTSMASPHVAGTVALILSANPALVGDLAAIVTILDDTAADRSDLQCGGSADDNNVWGEGMLDALSAVEAALPPR